MPYHITKTVDYSFNDAIQRATDALKTEGFGVLTEIDVKDTLKQKLNADFRDYRILGACNPEFAHRSYEIDGCGKKRVVG